MTVLTDKDREFAYAFLPDRESYHSHKENSAYAAFLLEASLFSALITTDVYASFLEKFPNASLCFLAVILFLWALIHVFMRWQLRNRRIAAIQVSTLLRALLDDLQEKPPAITNNASRDARKADIILDYLIPWPRATHIPDTGLRNFPEWYRSRYFASQKTGAVFGEAFPSYGSLVIL